MNLPGPGAPAVNRLKGEPHRVLWVSWPLVRACCTCGHIVMAKLDYYQRDHYAPLAEAFSRHRRRALEADRRGDVQ
jgi:hypothetical protein